MAGHAEGPTDEDGSSKWWRGILLAVLAGIAAAIAWGSLSPRVAEIEERPAPRNDTPDDSITPDDGSVEAAAAGPMSEGSGIRLEPAPLRIDRPPPWLRSTIAWSVGLVIVVAIGLGVLGILREVLLYVLLALFFSFAMEPAVNYMHSRWGWSRGAATGVLLVGVLAMLVLLVLILIPALLNGAATLADRLPQAARDLSTWASDHLGVDVSTSSLQSGARVAASSLESSATTPMSALVGFTASLVGGLFAMFTVGMFIFYMVAEAPRFKRAVLSLFRERRQEELLAIWEAAIEKTGGYFYGKLLLAGINGGLFFVLLLVVGVPGAGALAFFQGTVAAFIPIVGTYVAAIVPLIISFITVGWAGSLAIFLYVLIYQQVENYLISPKIQGKTMQLHPAVAFAAAMAGGAIGGLLWAFLALPFAATIQASASLWIQHHEVVENELTRMEPVPRPPNDGARVRASWFKRSESTFRSTKGWLRRWL